MSCEHGSLQLYWQRLSREPTHAPPARFGSSRLRSGGALQRTCAGTTCQDRRREPGQCKVSSVSLSKIPGGSISPPHQGIIVTADQRAGAPQRRRLAPPKAGAPRRRSRKSLDSPNHGSGYRASAHVSSPGNLSLTKGSPAVPSRKAVPDGSDRVMSRSHKTCCRVFRPWFSRWRRCRMTRIDSSSAPRRPTTSTLHWSFQRAQGCTSSSYRIALAQGPCPGRRMDWPVAGQARGSVAQATGSCVWQGLKDGCRLTIA